MASPAFRAQYGLALGLMALTTQASGQTLLLPEDGADIQGFLKLTFVQVAASVALGSFMPFTALRHQ